MSSEASGSTSSAPHRGQVQSLSFLAQAPMDPPMKIAAGASTRLSPRSIEKQTAMIIEPTQKPTDSNFHIDLGGAGVTWHLHE